MHYSSRAFSKHPEDPAMATILPRAGGNSERAGISAADLGRRGNLSEVDVRKVKKMYKCAPFSDWHQSCSSDSDCGFNEFCESYVFGGQCRTLLPDGSLCLRWGLTRGS